MLGFTSAKHLKASFRRFVFGLHQHCKNRSWALLSKALEMKILKRARVAHEQLKVCCSTE